MKLINTDSNLLKKLQSQGIELLYINLVPYKNNTCIKAYYEGEPIGDVEESSISSYLNKNTEVMFIKEYFNDDTGLIELYVETIV